MAENETQFRKDDKKNFEENDINFLINKLNLDYNNTEREEIINELGLRSSKSIKIDNLIYMSRENRRQSKFANFYENVINLITSPSELIVNILVEAKSKLLEYKESRLSEEIEWVIKKIKHEDIYNINVNVAASDENNALNMGSEFENTMKLLSEYSTDNFNRSKRDDIVTARKIGKSRLSIFSEQKLKMNCLNASPVNQYNTNLSDFKFKDENQSDIHFIPLKIVENFSTSPILNVNSLYKELNNSTDLTNMILPEEDHRINEEDKKINKFINENNIFDNINFDIFDYIVNHGRDMVLHNISLYIFNKYNLFLIVNKSRFDSFLDKIKVGYDFMLPYHNEIHAADVLNTSHIIAMQSNIQTEMDLTILDLSGFFIAAIIHDYKHPGLNNNYHINKRTELSRRYNDISVLENYHVSSAFKVISQNNSNIFCDIQNEEYRVVRKRIVECVLATDMAKHAKEVTRLKIKFENIRNSNNNESYLVSLIRETSEESKFDRQQEVLNFFIHCADISNPAKSTDVCRKWTELVMIEFFEQGDMEKKSSLPISFLCDRLTTNIPKSQIGFINNIVTPCFNLLVQIAPKLIFLVENLKTNVKYWSNLLEDENRTSI